MPRVGIDEAAEVDAEPPSELVTNDRGVEPLEAAGRVFGQFLERVKERGLIARPPGEDPPVAALDERDRFPGLLGPGPGL